MNIIPINRKLVAVLNNKIEAGRAMNALAHMALGLGSSVSNVTELRLQDYADSGGGLHPAISDIPFIILKGNSQQIRQLREEALSQSIPYTDFTHTMIGTNYVEQHQATLKTPELGLEYFGICLFGDWHLISGLTKKFSLWS
jgi:hypothetical protein